MEEPEPNQASGTWKQFLICPLAKCATLSVAAVAVIGCELETHLYKNTDTGNINPVILDQDLVNLKHVLIARSKA